MNDKSRRMKDEKCVLRWVVATAVLCVAVEADARTTIPLYDEAGMRAACEVALERAQSVVAKIEAVPLNRATVANTLDAWNTLQVHIDDIVGPADLYANVSPDPRVRAASELCSLKLNAFNTELNQNEKLYQRIKALKVLTPHQKKLQKDLTENFEDAGVALPADRRVRAKEILDRLEALRQTFEKNIREDGTKLVFTPEEMKGLPQDYLDKAKHDEKGNYLLGFDYPEYEPFINLADNEEARKRYYIAFVKRGGEQNLALMNEIMQLRLQLAELHGFPSYSHYVLRRRMVEEPGKVKVFLDEVKKTVHDLEAKEIAELRAAKAETLGKPLEAVTLNRWDANYYQEKVRKARFNVDREALRKYFPMPAAMDYVMHVSSQLYGVKFKRAYVPVWHEAVAYYDIVDATTGKFLSGFYLDLYPRDDKYNHAAAFGVYSPSRLARRTPVSVLVANVNRNGLDQMELEVLLHEFGHVLNSALSVVDYVPHGLPAWDFIEAPSQMFEEWARRWEALMLFRKVCGTCPVIEKELVERLADARRFGSGIHYSRQCLYAAYDMAMTGERPGDALQVWKSMEAEEPFGYTEGTLFPASFAHIANPGYGAGYYGYLWSEVLALDMLSAYGSNLMNPRVGRRFRNIVLAQGGQAPAMDLVRKFLGRQSSSKAFFAEIANRR